MPEEIEKENNQIVDEAKYFEAVGKRKTAIARIRLFTQGDKTIEVNKKDYKEYFSTSDLQQIIESSLKKMKAEDKFKVLALVSGGGIHAQAEAIRHGIARALVEFNPDFRKRLRRAGHLTRDSRIRERKKFGLKRARKAPQWAKR
jgi:small subunit ribosomal protein S9